MRTMVEQTTRDRRAERHAATRAEILAAAWKLVRDQGLGGLTLRDVASKIGMRPPSLYHYFDSKHAVYDAMFAEGNRTLLARMAAEEWPTEPRALLTKVARLFVAFGAEDPARSQLLFQRTIPDFEPSPESYALAVEVVAQARAHFAEVGLTDSSQFDLWTALVSGLASQQAANDPAGDRWLRLIDDAVEMYADHVLPGRPGKKGRRP
jgi:AcrR family transcriptional regulator